MSLRSLLTRPLTIVHRARQASSAYGDEQLVEVDRLDVLGQLHLTTTDNDLLGQDTVRARWQCVLGPEVPVGRDDLVEVDGQPFQIVGEPYLAWRPPSRSHHHTELLLAEVVG